MERLWVFSELRVRIAVGYSSAVAALNRFCGSILLLSVWFMLG
jgi:hypothetical protein